MIGGGPAGICAVKCCLDEGLTPVCYEQHDDIGTNFNALIPLGHTHYILCLMDTKGGLLAYLTGENKFKKSEVSFFWSGISQIILTEILPIV